MKTALVLIDYENELLSRFHQGACTDSLKFDRTYPIPAEDIEMFRVFPLDFKDMIGAAE